MTTYAPLALDVIDIPGCDDDSTWVYYAETVGWTDGQNLVNVWETGAPDPVWNEEHELPSVAFGPNQSYDILELELQDEARFADYSPNVNTLFECGVHDVGADNTYAMRVYDLDGNYADCAIFSTEGDPGVDQVFSDPQAGVGDPVTRPEEINAADCAEWTIP